MSQPALTASSKIDASLTDRWCQIFDREIARNEALGGERRSTGFMVWIAVTASIIAGGILSGTLGTLAYAWPLYLTVPGLAVLLTFYTGVTFYWLSSGSMYYDNVRLLNEYKDLIPTPNFQRFLSRDLCLTQFSPDQMVKVCNFYINRGGMAAAGHDGDAGMSALRLELRDR